MAIVVVPSAFFAISLYVCAVLAIVIFVVFGSVSCSCGGRLANPSYSCFHIDILNGFEKAPTKILKYVQDSRSLSVYFKNTTARMRHFQRKLPASLSLVLRQWYAFLLRVLLP